jgi:hypothetical protein
MQDRNEPVGHRGIPCSDGVQIQGSTCSIFANDLHYQPVRRLKWLRCRRFRSCWVSRMDYTSRRAAK